jgi:hypothetical protein
MDSLFMVLSSVGTAILLALGMDIPGIFLVTAVLTILAAVIIRSAARESQKD